MLGTSLNDFFVFVDWLFVLTRVWDCWAPHLSKSSARGTDHSPGRAWRAGSLGHASAARVGRRSVPRFPGPKLF